LLQPQSSSVAAIASLAKGRGMALTVLIMALTAAWPFLSHGSTVLKEGIRLDEIQIEKTNTPITIYAVCGIRRKRDLTPFARVASRFKASFLVLAARDMTVASKTLIPTAKVQRNR